MVAVSGGASGLSALDWAAAHASVNNSVLPAAVAAPAGASASTQRRRRRCS
jgi:hypothetical protein